MTGNEENISQDQKYLNKCFENVELKFNNLEQSLNRIEKHLEKQNGSIAELRTESNKRLVVVEDFRHLEKDFETVKTKIDDIDKNLLEVRFFTKYPKVFFGIVIVIVSATLGFSFYNSRDNKAIRETVGGIKTSIEIANAPTRSLKNIPDTTEIDISKVIKK